MTDRKTARLFLQSFARMAGHIVLVMVSTLLAGIASLVGVLLLRSPGKPKPFVDEDGRALPGSISEKIHVPINGLEQGMFIKSQDATNPALLVLHGGPGMPDYFLTDR